MWKKDRNNILLSVVITIFRFKKYIIYFVKTKKKGRVCCTLFIDDDEDEDEKNDETNQGQRQGAIKKRIEETGYARIVNRYLYMCL